MSLPEGFDNAQQYFSAALSFLKDHQWIYNYRNTAILTERVFESSPTQLAQDLDGFSYADLKLLAAYQCEASFPDAFRRLVGQIKYLTASQRKAQTASSSVAFARGVSEKKRHEVESVGNAIGKLCADNAINMVLDAGCGLGYFTQHLHQSFGLKALGLEANHDKYLSALSRQQTFFSGSEPSVKFVHHFVDESSRAFIAEQIRSFSPETGPDRVCITTLHGCADLSVTLMQLFLETEEITAGLVVPCCYHLLNQPKALEFSNFPLSAALKAAFAEFEAGAFLGVPFLRLACQQSCKALATKSPNQVRDLAENLLRRCILQQVVQDANWKMSRNRAKPGRVANESPNSLRRFCRNFDIVGSDGSPVFEEMVVRKMSECWALHIDKTKFFALIITLQASIQSLCENLVLFDRVQWVREKGFQAECVQISDEVVSPRCYALILKKNELNNE